MISLTGYVFSPLPAHALAGVLIAMAVLGIMSQRTHAKLRKDLYLAGPPGTIASALTLTTNAGFFSHLNSRDDPASIERKLEGLRFRLHPITNAITLDGPPPPPQRYSGQYPPPSPRGSDVRASLLGPEQRVSAYEDYTSRSMGHLKRESLQSTGGQLGYYP